MIPPCPSWCELPAGDEYDSYDTSPNDDGSVTHSRFHERQIGSVDVTAIEHNRAGYVEVTGLSIECPETRREDVSAEQDRMIAADLIAAADLRDTIKSATRTCPKSAQHAPHTWPSMVAGGDWNCPGIGR